MGSTEVSLYSRGGFYTMDINVEAISKEFRSADVWGLALLVEENGKVITGVQGNAKALAGLGKGNFDSDNEQKYCHVTPDQFKKAKYLAVSTAIAKIRPGGPMSISPIERYSASGRYLKQDEDRFRQGVTLLRWDTRLMEFRAKCSERVPELSTLLKDMPSPGRSPLDDEAVAIIGTWKIVRIR